MTSQLNVDTIVDKAGSGGTNVKVATTSTYVSEGGGTTQNTVLGLAKFFMSVTNTTINDSLNLSSISDSGDFLVTTFTNNMNNDDYVSSGQGSQSNFNSNRGNGIAIANVTTSNHHQFAMTAGDAGYASGSYALHHSCIHGDLA